MRYAVIGDGAGRSFPEADAFLSKATNAKDAEILIYAGAPFAADSRRIAILVELEDESLAEHVGKAGSQMCSALPDTGMGMTHLRS